MGATVDELVAQAEQLSVADLELLIDRLRHTLPQVIDPEIEAAWIEEAERRLDAIERGDEKTMPWDVARKRLGL
jgi:hypothetical protein